MSAATAAYACFVTGNFSVQGNAQNANNYSHFLSSIYHHPMPRNPNLPPETETEPDPHADDCLDVHLYKYVGSRGSVFFSDTYAVDDVVYATGSGRILFQDGTPRLNFFTTHLNNLTPPDAPLQVESEDYCTATFVFLGQCIEHRPDRIFVLRTGSYDPQVCCTI